MLEIEKVFFIHRKNNLKNNRGLHNIKTFLLSKDIICDDINMGKLKSYFFLKQLYFLVLKFQNDYDLIIIRDPIFVLLLSIFRRDLKNILFLSKEMYEYQVPVASIKNCIRFLIYKIAHDRALRYARFILFSNDLRRNYYLKKKISNLKFRSKIFESHYFHSPHDANNDDQICESKIKSKYSEINQLTEPYDILFCYVGSLQKGRDIDLFLEAFEMASRKEQKYKVGLVIAGHDRDNYALRIKQLKDVEYLGVLTFQEVSYLYKICDWGLMHYSNNLKNTKYCAPLKLYEYLHFNLGVICNSNRAMMLKSNLISHYYDTARELSELIENPEALVKKTSFRRKDLDFEFQFTRALAQLEITIK